MERSRRSEFCCFYRRFALSSRVVDNLAQPADSIRDFAILFYLVDHVCESTYQVPCSALPEKQSWGKGDRWRCDKLAGRHYVAVIGGLWIERVNPHAQRGLHEI